MIQALVPVDDFEANSSETGSWFRVGKEINADCLKEDFYGGMLAVEIIDRIGEKVIVSKECCKNGKLTTLVWEVPIDAVQFIDFRS